MLVTSASLAAQMCITGDIASAPDCLTNGWETYGTSKSVNLTSGDGLKTVTAYFRDVALNQTLTSDAITLDTQSAYGERLTLDPTDYTISTGVTATLAANGATEMCLSGDFVGAPADCSAGSSGSPDAGGGPSSGTTVG